MPRTTLSDRLFAALQSCLPTRLISTVVHALAGARAGWFKSLAIRLFHRSYAIDMAEAAEPDPRQYPSLNAFFTRALRSDVRPLAGDGQTVVSPVDGTLGAFGSIDSGQLCQVKGMTYDLATLLGGRADWCERFANGHFATLYLAPHNYHRVHMPLAGRLEAGHYLPGRLFGVNPASVRAIPRLFTRNERLVSLFDTPAGRMAVIMVSAFCVGGIETVWTGTVCPPHRHARPVGPTPEQPVRLARGAEMGRFNLGSTVILLFQPRAITWADGLATGNPLVLGQALGSVQP